MKLNKQIYQLLLILGILVYNVQILHAQGFWSEARAISASGEVIRNKGVTVRCSLLTNNDEASNILYVEKHSNIRADENGNIRFKVGTGTLVAGNWEQINWAADVFQKIELDSQGGANTIAYFEIGSTPKALFSYTTAEAITSGKFGISVFDFGAKGNGTSDDTFAFKSALKKAAEKGRKVLVPSGVYKVTETINVPAGVTIIGEGTGETPLSTPHNGSVIYFEGSGYAMQFSGCNSGVRDLAILDKAKTAKGGIRILADNKLVESLRMHNILLTYFIKGSAFSLEAKNNGAIYYSSFYNIRIRHALHGIVLKECDEHSCVNSNSFYHGTISGGGFSTCLWVNGGNNNKFYGTIIEPRSSEKGHVWVDKGEIQCHDIRIEAIEQPGSRPTIFLSENTRHCVFDGFYAGGLTIDNGNNDIRFRSGKDVKHRNFQSNLFENAGLLGLNQKRIPAWKLDGNDFDVELSSEEIIAGHKVLKFIVPVGQQVVLSPDVKHLIHSGKQGWNDELSFGAYVKTNKSEAVKLSMQSVNGFTDSAYVPGDMQWHFVGSMNQVKKESSVLLKYIFQNNTSGELEVYFTVPTCTFGTNRPLLAAKSISTVGGKMNGTLSTAMLDINNLPTNGQLDLPKYGNTFLVVAAGKITRINQTIGNRFPKGTIINLLFRLEEEQAVDIQKSAYLHLKSSMRAGSGESISLVSLGNGEWIELNRNINSK